VIIFKVLRKKKIDVMKLLFEWRKNMPKKGTKKVRGHTRSRTLVDFGNIKVKDPLSTKYVNPYFRKKRR